jgi:hypothetical protein
MKIKLKCKYCTSDRDNIYDCEILIENKTIHFISNPYESINDYKIDNSKVFKLHKPLSIDPFSKDFNYLIKYINTSGNDRYLLLNLSILNKFKYKLMFKEYLIQSKELKIDLLKYFIGGVFGIIFTMLTQLIIQRYNADPEIPPKADNQKSLDIKNDTITIK